MIRALAAAAALALLCLAGARAEDDEPGEKIVAALSQNDVAITATFTGSEIFIYGAIERGRFADERDDGLEVIVTITGPSERTVIRKKERVFGIWANTEAVEIDRAPSFYAVATTGPFEDIISQTEDLRHKVSVERAVRLVGAARIVADPREFSDAIVRLRRASGAYFENIGSVEIISRTLFQTRVQLPANLVEGDYAARVFLLRDRNVLDKFETEIKVRKVGLERWIYNLAHEQSLLYGILSIVVALAAGWGASEAFRLLRR